MTTLAMLNEMNRDYATDMAEVQACVSAIASCRLTLAREDSLVYVEKWYTDDGESYYTSRHELATEEMEGCFRTLLGKCALEQSEVDSLVRIA